MSADASLLRVGPIVEARANARTRALHRRLRHRGRHRRHGRRHSRRHRVRHRHSHRRFVLRGRRRRVHRRPVLRLRGPRPQVLVLLAVVLSSECRPVLPRLILPRLGGAGSSAAGPGGRALGGERGMPRALDGERGTGSCAQGTAWTPRAQGLAREGRREVRGCARRCARARMCAEDARARACRRASMLSTRLARVARTPY